MNDAQKPISFTRYSGDLEALCNTGLNLYHAMVVEVVPERSKELGLTDEAIKKLPSFKFGYQSWYSEALACVTQLLPDRVEDFVSYYKAAKTRKEITFANYSISDCLQGITITRGYDAQVVVGPYAALPSMQQQLTIVMALKARFRSSLFDIRTLVQADVFDNELDAAEELNKQGYQRASGALVGVVLEGHLQTVCVQHKLSFSKNPTISELNELLKKNDVLDIPTWRFVQHLTDIRNQCDHKKSVEPTKEQISELIAGVRKVTKTVF